MTNSREGSVGHLDQLQDAKAEAGGGITTATSTAADDETPRGVFDQAVIGRVGSRRFQTTPHPLSRRASGIWVPFTSVALITCAHEAVK